MTTTADDEWSLLSFSYKDVLLPRFEPLYRCIGNILVDYIKSNKTKDKYKLLDYGTGPGEPVLTIVQLIREHQIFNVEFQATDSSTGMISLAKQRFNRLNIDDLNISFDTCDILSDLNTYDFITSSLVLPYVSNKGDLLEQFYKHLNADGLLIHCHWPHPSEVPFLSLLKRINRFMRNGQHISVSDLESNISFSCSNQQITRQMFTEQGFIIKEWISVPLPMSFPDIRTFLSFSPINPWFNDENLYSQAEKETQSILHDEYGFESNSNSSFNLPSHAIIVIASK